ncbi:MAG: DUF5348 domain-containing protein [Lachnospirales bacterium]
MKANEVIREMKSINNSISQIFKNVGYVDGTEYDKLEVDEENPNDIFLEREMSKIFYMYECSQKLFAYLDLEIKYESKLFLNDDGRYETEKGDNFTCGSIIEYLSNDERYNDYPFWRKSRIESDGGEYYIVDEPKISLSGLLVRVRG